MAKQITFSASLNVTPDGFNPLGQSFSKTLDMSGAEALEGFQTIGTVAEELTIGDVDPLGIFLVANLDSANFIELATDSGMANKFAKLLPGEFCLVPAAAAASIYAQADTAACDAVVIATER